MDGLFVKVGGDLMTSELNDRLFISYSSKDSDIVHPLGKLLEASGSKPFIDTNDLTFSQNWESQIDEAIATCRSMLVFWSKNAAKSNQVEREWKTALAHNRPIIPILLTKKPPLPEELKLLHGVRMPDIFDKWRGMLFQNYADGDGPSLHSGGSAMRDMMVSLSKYFKLKTPGYTTDIRPKMMSAFNDVGFMNELGDKFSAILYQIDHSDD